ncbi:MAG: hypothetical protein IH627_11520 [Rubrivivax sp.]|nr:hypothetical protein [Rubrivivax sp.]
MPPAILQRELADGDVRLLQTDAEMPNMSRVCSYRSGPETLFQEVATAKDFAQRLPVDVARMPAA